MGWLHGDKAIAIIMNTKHWLCPPPPPPPPPTSYHVQESFQNVFQFQKRRIIYHYGGGYQSCAFRVKQLHTFLGMVLDPSILIKTRFNMYTFMPHCIQLNILFLGFSASGWLAFIVAFGSQQIRLANDELHTYCMTNFIESINQI